MQRELRRIIALAEQLDDESARRVERLAADTAERETVSQGAGKLLAMLADIQEDRDDDDADDALALDIADEDDRHAVEDLLDDLFDDYGNRDADPVVIVDRMCARLGLTRETAASFDPDAEDADPAVGEKLRILWLARDYLRDGGRLPRAPRSGPVHGPPGG